MNIGIIGNALKTMENSSSIGMFARDTGGCLISKLALSRSRDESVEISFAELTESALFYFSAPVLAKGAAALFSKIYNISRDTLSKPVSELKNLSASELKKAKLGRFMQTASVFSIVLPASFAIAPLRNILTLKRTGKDKFVNVIELDKTKQQNKKEEAAEKAEKFIKNICTVSAVSIASAAGIAALSKNNAFYKKSEPLIDKTIKHFGFTKSGDLTLKHYGALIYPASIAGYFYASRDKYEKQENARRFSVTVPLLFFGEKLIQNPIHKAADKIFKTNIFNNGSIKTYNEIIQSKAPERMREIKAKNAAYGLTFFINTMAIAAGTALLNRIETKRRYEREMHQGAAKAPVIEQKENPIWKNMKI